MSASVQVRLHFGSAAQVNAPHPLDNPRRCITVDVDLHRLILISTVFQVHRDAVLELEHDQAVVHNLAPCDVCIHDVVECGIRPPAFLPLSHYLTVTEQLYRRLDCETEGAKREL